MKHFKQILISALILTLIVAMSLSVGMVAYADNSKTINISSNADIDDFINKLNGGETFEGYSINLLADVQVYGGGHYYAKSNSVFKGNFNGNNHTISVTTSDGGLFSNLNNATIKNLNVYLTPEDLYHSTEGHGHLAKAAEGYCKIQNVNIVSRNKRMSFKSYSNFGGFVGLVKTGAKLTLEDCSYYVHITLIGGRSDEHANFIGGFIGFVEKGAEARLERCENNGCIYTENLGEWRIRGSMGFNPDDVLHLTAGNAGGLVGGSEGVLVMDACVNNGEVVAALEHAGGMVAKLCDKTSNSCFLNCVNNGLIDGPDSAGGIVGYFGNKDTNAVASIKWCTNNGEIKSKDGYAAGIAAFIDSNAIVDGSHWLLEDTNNGKVSGKYAGGIVGVNCGYIVLDGCINSSTITSENGIAAGILAWNEDDNVQIKNCHNYSNILSKDEAGGIIAYFGDRSSSPKITINQCINDGAVLSTDGRSGGIAAKLDSNGILKFTDVENNGGVYGGWTAGGICSESEGQAIFENVVNNAYITSESSCAGGILGWNKDDALVFKSCKNTMDISGKNEAGGILGYTGDEDGDQDMSFEDCYNSGYIKSTKAQAGGIAAKLCTDGTHSLKNVSNSGTVYGYWSAGGIVADTMGATTFEDATNSGSVSAVSESAAGILSWSENQDIIFNNCSNSGVIYGNKYAGGIGGVMYDEAADPAIFADNCKNSGTVNAKNSDAGGIIGALCTDGDCTFINCKNASGGKITGARESGGIFGWTCGNNTLVKNCSNSGSITTTGSKDDGFYAGTLYGSSENGVTCEGCTNYTASIFMGYSLWIIAACIVVIIVTIIWFIIAKKKKKMVN